ncbi:vacuolar assembly/sorting protein DID4-like protein [Dinothrombium tinctorium]|uniref:Vacuolar assembly/sorting protein DID4-like protein n=1 Tax=Dinothrombium tinctorium TaxID=1965070 RepID=A0A443QET7_9ACAR|nr:vacuolar assembly/sorting protein DID4-like protein [Dinothrombium tinctorium]
MFKKPSPAEQMRAQTRDLRKAQRDIDRSKADLERQEKQLLADIKKAAKTGNKDVCGILAKQLVNLRKQKTRLVTTSSQIGAVGAQTKIIHANTRIAGAMASTTKTMKNVNQQINTGQIMKSMQDFERENAKMDMKDELIDDTLSSVLDHSDDEQEQDAVVNQVLDEIGIEMIGKVANAPMAKGSLGESSQAKKITDSEIEEQLSKLKM